MILPLEKQVTSLEVSKRMRDLGFPQESLFCWITRMEGDEEVSFIGTNKDWQEMYEGQYGWVRISAYTVGECGEMLPREIEYKASSKDKSGFDGFRPLNLIVGKTVIDNGWYVMYSDPHPANKVPVYSTHADTEADARGLLLIYLKEQNLI